MSTATLTRATAEVAATPALRAAIYLRISDDKAGRGLGVERQTEDTRALVERRGYHLVVVYSDNDISAYSGKPRPGYLALVEDVRAGRIDVIVTYRADRLYRLARELEDLITLLDDTRMIVDTVESGTVDLSTTSGRRMARIHGAIAQGESEDIRDKVRRTMIQNAEMGKPHGATRTYGLDGTRRATEGWIVVEEEAAVIREAADRLLAGESMLAIVRDLNARGIPAPKGGAWSAQSLKNVVISARVAGWREHKPGRPKNTPTPFAGGEFTHRAEWPAILDRVLVERLRRLLGDPSRRRGPNGRTYLLSGGLAKCAECGGNLAGQATSGGRRAYRCSVAGGGCGRVMIGADGVEEFVVDEVREALRSGRFDGEVEAAQGKADEAEAAWSAVAALREEEAAYDAAAAAGTIKPAAYLAISAGVAARLAEAEAALARVQEHEASALLSGGLVEFDRAWAVDVEAGDLSRMRARLSAALVEVRVGRAVPGRNKFDPDRVEFVWRA
jgi:site-specific DNA recombinase